MEIFGSNSKKDVKKKSAKIYLYCRFYWQIINPEIAAPAPQHVECSHVPLPHGFAITVGLSKELSTVAVERVGDAAIEDAVMVVVVIVVTLLVVVAVVDQGGGACRSTVIYWQRLHIEGNLYV